MFGFRFKVFLLVVLVALLTAGTVAGLVAWRIDQATQSSVHTEQETVDEIGDSLVDFGEERASWRDVSVLAKEWNADTGQRILLTTLSGDRVFDSADAKGRSTPPTTKQPVLLQPRVTNDEYIDPFEEDLKVVYPDDDSAVDALKQFRGDARLYHCASRDADVWREDDESFPAECDGVEEPSDSEIREDYAALEACAADELGEEGKSNCRGQVVEQRAMDISPEPLLLHLGAEKPFSVTFPAVQLAAIGTVVLGAVVLVSALLARRVIRPIDSLIGASREVATGNLSAKVSISGTDEMAELGGNFNRMVDSLHNAERQRRQLIADSAHELRTPLSNINGYLEAISDGVLEASPEYIESLREESALLARIVDDLRLLALSDAGQLPHEPVTTDVRQLLHGCRLAHQAAADRAGVRLEMEVCQPPPVSVDPERMRQAIGNLLSNAVRHTPLGGTITLRAFETGEASVIEVADTGEGLPAGQHDKVFDRFWRADPARHRSTGGSGLGLAITREIVTAHGGTITARDSAPGAVFAISLPHA